MATIPSTIAYSPQSSAYGAGYEFHWKSGGTVGNAYQNGTTLVYKFWKTGDGNHDRTIQYLNGTWSDHNTTENPVSVTSNSGDQQTITFALNPGPTTHTFTNPFYSSGSGSGSGSGYGSGRQTFSSGESGIINVEFNKLTDSSIELGFDWQGISVYQVYVDRGGTETWTQLSLTGSSGTVTGYTGAGAHALTGLNEGDKVWVNNAYDANGRLPVYTHTKIDWSVGYVSGTKSVIAKTFAYDTGQSTDLYFWSYIPGRSGSSTDTTYITHDGTLQTVSEPFERGRTYKMTNFYEDPYGTPYKVKKVGTSSNFW